MKSVLKKTKKKKYDAFRQKKVVQRCPSAFRVGNTPGLQFT